MRRTKIEWCDFTWNPVIGCRGGCPYCYARRMASRFHMTEDFSVPTWSDHNFERPFPRRPSRIFVNSMSDVADWEAVWTERVCKTVDAAPQHTFLFLSKRPWDWRGLSLGPNAMLGYSVTQQADVARLAAGRRFGVEFLSIEPLLGPVTLPEKWTNIRWIIVGAETGNRKGKVRPSINWLLDVHGYAQEHSVPLFFKESLREVWTASTRMPFPQEYPVAPA